MQSIKRMPLIGIIVMILLSFTNLLGLNIAGASVIVGVVIFFINKVVEKEPYRDSGLDFKAIGTDLKDRKIWLWLVLPLVMDGVSITIGKLFLPGYLEHVAARAGMFVSFEVSMLSIFQLAFLALGEEIAWRAFFQRQLSKALPIIPVLLSSSLLFGLGHLQRGDAVIVIYDIFFVFINSILYGIIFYKSRNAWISGISHFIANLFSIIVMLQI